MCRLLGIVSSETTDFRFCLHQAPRSLAAISHEHPHGWGLAVHDRRRGWELHRAVACAGRDERFGSVAAESRGELLVAHVRKRTVGDESVYNTHPFRRDDWIFAHNGTIDDIRYLEERTTRRRRGEIEGETDSERYFAYLLTAIDEAGATRGVRLGAPGAVDRALHRALLGASAAPGSGSANFLLSDGEVLYAYRRGRSLHLLERGPQDPVLRERRASGLELGTPWSPRRRAILIASEPLSAEPWSEIAEGTLLRIDGGDVPEASTVFSQPSSS